MSADLIGQNLGQYRVMEMIGQGGMARVYRAYQSSLARYVAIKAIAAQMDSSADTTFAMRFTNEARLIARLTHPNIVPVHDYGEDKGWAFIVMEYIAGGTLRDRIVKADGQHTRVDLPLALELLAQAALALDFAHTNGVVHRDVKPGNMLLRTDDHLLLSDFGIAAILEANQNFTRTGANIGTPQYMAPEQGLPNGVIDGRTDIYALGVVAFQSVTGRLPFVADTPMATVMKHIQEPPPRPSALVPGLPMSVESVILRAMAKDPKARFQRANEMAAQLRAAISDVRHAPRPAQQTLRRDDIVPVGSGPVVIPLPPRGKPGAPGTCFRCGAANNAQNRFCTTCGYDLSGARGNVDRYLLPNKRPLRCRITIRNGPLTGHSFLLHQDVTKLGRTAGNDVVIPDGTVSRNHARLFFFNGQWSIEDEGSSNGTWVNGARIARPTPVMHGDEVRLGDIFVKFELVG
ncbi:MAG TPA: protein kinase [Ktedonobacterales bacterium]|nr:protein kinase [Ktedonobacterales bacterium]